MINIWEYADAKNLRITSTSGKVYVGDVLSINDAEEMENAKEDEINLITKDGLAVCLKPSEIKKIEK